MLPAWLSLRPAVPANWDDLTPAWFEKVLQRDFPDAVIRTARIAGTDDGTNRRARFELDYAAGTGPRRVFIKAHSANHRWVHLRNGNLFIEARLFASGAVLPLEHPQVYLAVPDYPRLDFLLVMEDLALRGADMRDATRPMSVAEVASGLKGLAALHSRYWGIGKHSHAGLGWLRTWEPTKGWQYGLRRHVPTGLKRADHVLPQSIKAFSGNEIVDLWARNVATLSRGPQTLTHGDAHIGNTYVLPDGTTGFLDWQVSRRGNWIQDVGYFLIGSLTLADCRAHERELLHVYRNALSIPGDQLPDQDEIWLRYRQSPAYGLAVWLSTLGTSGYQRGEVSLALTERYAAAFVDLGCLEALK